MFFVIFVEGLSGRYLLNTLFNQNNIFMKKFIVILVLSLTAISTSAQHRIQPVVKINEKTYEEVIDLMDMMVKSARIERIENIKLDANRLTTYYGEFVMARDVNSINISNSEFTQMLSRHIANPSRSWYDIESIQTELLIQNVKLFEYLSKRLSEDHRIKKMYIVVDNKSGASYIRVDYHKL